LETFHILAYLILATSSFGGNTCFVPYFSSYTENRVERISRFTASLALSDSLGNILVCLEDEVYKRRNKLLDRPFPFRSLSVAFIGDTGTR
jgi:hypothetical protein